VTLAQAIRTGAASRDFSGMDHGQHDGKYEGFLIAMPPLVETELKLISDSMDGDKETTALTWATPPVRAAFAFKLAH
jgi:hypothetical protein